MIIVCDGVEQLITWATPCCVLYCGGVAYFSQLETTASYQVAEITRCDHCDHLLYASCLYTAWLTWPGTHSLCQIVSGLCLGIVATSVLSSRRLLIVLWKLIIQMVLVWKIIYLHKVIKLAEKGNFILLNIFRQNMAVLYVDVSVHITYIICCTCLSVHVSNITCACVCIYMFKCISV